MYIHQKVKECDFTDRVYNKPVDGVGCVTMGATGRYCVVMIGGPEYKEKLIKKGMHIRTVEEAYDYIEKNTTGYPDF